MIVVIFVCTPVQPIMLNRMSIAKPWKKIIYSMMKLKLNCRKGGKL